MFKLIGAITCGLAAAGAVAYFAMRPSEQRANDMSTAKKIANDAVTSVKDYATQLFPSKTPNPPASI